MSYVRLTTTAGAQEPVSIADLRAFGRIVSSTEDWVLESLLLAARQEIERMSGLALVPGTFRISLDCWKTTVDLVPSPVRSVDVVTYQYADGVAYVVDSDAYFFDASRYRLAFARWSEGPWGLRTSAGIEIDVTAGYATRDDVPADVRMDVIRAALLRYEHRDDPEMLDKARRAVAESTASYAVVQV